MQASVGCVKIRRTSYAVGRLHATEEGHISGCSKRAVEDYFDALETLPPGSGGEIQLTDALARQIEAPGLFGCRFGGERFDCGNRQGFLTTNIYFGLR